MERDFDRRIRRFTRRRSRASFLPPFADTSHVGAGAEMDSVPFEPCQLGQAQARLGRDQQQSQVV
jgi:hypothetical protein